MSSWLIVLAAGIGCFGLRGAMVALVGRRALPTWLDRAAEFVMPASFAGIGAVALTGAGAGGPQPPVLLAAAITGAVATRRTPPVAVLCGMMVLWLDAAVPVL